MSKTSFNEQAAGWFERLQQRCKEPGNRAALRQWLSDAGHTRAFAELMAIRGTLDDDDFATVAALYAWHPEHVADGADLGTLCRHLSAGHNTFEGRFRRLLLCNREELRRHLQPVILAARSKGHPLDYLQLYYDLRSWNHDYYGEGVRRRWAEKFWGPSEEPAPVPAEPRAPTSL